ncbi:MAG: hypothetical protein AUI14_15705 [Actinobacteria bacterium 13_2_20CM_2_71_6]|nr:MAG: hypothetical protein AUI14_15705 [Actinobacteria bacterium 13_2_20CM_2_71_6]
MARDKQRLQFRVLGPFEVTWDSRPINVGGPQLRAVLARLVLDAGRTVSLAALVDELWGDRAPADASRTVRTYVSRLRNTIQRAATGLRTAELLVTRPPGYQLRVDPETVADRPGGWRPYCRWPVPTSRRTSPTWRSPS